MANIISFEHKGSDVGAPIKADEPIGVLVVDDHPVVRYGVVNLLNAQPGFKVIAEASSCTEFRSKLHGKRPDVVVLDLQLGDAQGTEALVRLREQCPDMPTVVYSAYENDVCISNVLKIGTQGYVFKGSPTDILCDAIRTVARGECYLDPALTSKLIGQLGGGRERRVAKQSRLTERESTVLTQIAAGRRNKEIADDLCISERTVKYHVSALFGKLRASNRTELAKIAVRDGLVGH